MQTECLVQIPDSLIADLNAKATATLLEVPANNPTNIISHDQKYVVRVCLDFQSKWKKIICAEWCINLGVEGCGSAKEFGRTAVIKLDPCKTTPDCYDFEIDGKDFESANSNHCGEVFSFCLSGILRDSCPGSNLPLGVAFMCNLGPVMVY